MQQALRTDVPRRYAPMVAGHRVSTQLDEDTLRLARELAVAAGMSLSAWVARAVRYHVRIEDGIRGVAEHEAEFGPIPEAALRAADEELDRRGVPRLDP